MSVEAKPWPLSKLPAFQGETHQGCMNCRKAGHLAPMDMLVGVGFGQAQLLKDGVVMYDEINVTDDDGYLSVEGAEAMAAVDPDHDWRIVINAPLHGETYQRHGKAQWVLVDSNRGFA